jgi:hypothetical protein
VVVAAGGVVAADRHQAGVFALGAGVGLHADGVEAGDRAQLGGEAFDHLEVAGGLVGRGEGWMSANSGQVTGIISLVALSFMVQEPSEIIEWSRARSRFCRRLR